MDLTRVCQIALDRNASDIHLKAGHAPVFRVNGELTEDQKLGILTSDTLAKMAWDIMSTHRREQFKVSNDVDLSWESGGSRFRVNVFRQRGSVSMVLRVIPGDVHTLETLKLPLHLRTIAQLRHGLVLVTGATGSGKSSTMAALVEEINRTRAAHIVTIEDPVEFGFRDQRSLISQREVGEDSKSFHSALRAALRQDPDVILVGELRDEETTEIVIQAAETGHLVLSSVHTIDAPETIHRLIGLFARHRQHEIRLRLGQALHAVISQRLLPARRGGRIPAIEILFNTGAIRECILDAERHREIGDHIRRGSDTHGTQSFDQAIFQLLDEGHITQETALAYASSPDGLQLRLHGVETIF